MPLTGPEIVLYELDDGIATITINREERLNAISAETFDRIEAQLRRFDADPDAKVAILTGAGARAFSAGGDLKEFTERGIAQLAEVRDGPPVRYPSASYAWETDKPVIAAVNGHALAGGFRFALLCDLRIAADHATFGITEAKVGRAAPWAMSLLWAVPLAIGLELLLTGESISAQRAYELGLVNRVVPSASLMDEARALARSIGDNAPLTVKAHKAMMYRAMDVGRTHGAMIADDLCRALYQSEDAQEGQRAFVEKRPPEVDRPVMIAIREVGPREGFQSEPPGIDLSAKAQLIDALSVTGLCTVQVASFASRSAVPQMADAEELIDLLEPRQGVRYTAVWFNNAGLERALGCSGLTVEPVVAVSGSATFAMKNWRSPTREMNEHNQPLLDRYQDLGRPVTINAAAAFGCNFEGRVLERDVLKTIEVMADSVRARGLDIEEICLADTMAWANPRSVRSLVRAARREFGTPLSLHLHDTRGLGIANAAAGLDDGVERFDSSIAGLGGCPFSGQRSAAGNIATEDLVLLCHELGHETGVEPAALLRAARVAEHVVGHKGNSRSLDGGHMSDDGVLSVS